MISFYGIIPQARPDLSQAFGRERDLPMADSNMDALGAWTLSIEALTPQTLPMSRLAKYMACLASLMGNHDKIHFKGLGEGSTKILYNVAPEITDAVIQRCLAAMRKNSKGNAFRARKRLGRMLQGDNSAGSLYDGLGEQVIHFPYHDNQTIPIGPIKQDGDLTGTLISIGGKRNLVPVHLQNGDMTYICRATRDMAKRLIDHLFGPPIRIHGKGTWKRDRNSRWHLTRFVIKDFIELSDCKLSQVVENIQKFKSSKWHELEDPHAELMRLRGHDEI